MLTAGRHTDEVAPPSGARRYSLLVPAALLATQERQRAIADLFVRVGWFDLAKVRLLEVGCGTGNNLLEFLQFGFKPEHLQGIELLTGTSRTGAKELARICTDHSRRRGGSRGCVYS